ncbi:MAG: outer membrane beta-barrel protein [Bacillota bacterium]
MKKGLFVTALTISLFIVFTSMVSAAPPEGSFFFGIEYGVADLNTVHRIYSSSDKNRYPLLEISESSQWEGPANSFFVGYNILSNEIDFLGRKPTFQLGLQGGYSDLGQHIINVNWTDLDDSIQKGYRKLEESSIDLLLSSTLFWENGFSLSAKVGVAQLRGTYTQNNIANIRRPDYPETFNAKIDYKVYRPEIGVGIGYLFNDRYNVYLQYTTILGESAEIEISPDKHDIPNTLYKVNKVTLGINIYMF